MRPALFWLTFALAVFVPPLLAQEARVPLVAVLETDPPEESIVPVLRESLHDLHYVEGRNIRFEVRTSISQNERLPDLVKEIVALKPAVIVSKNSATTLALRDRAGTIPVVMVVTFDPISLGVIQSLAHPGGTFTGLSTSGREHFGKRIELLKEFFPRLRRLFLLWTPIDSASPEPRSRRNAFEAVQSAAAPAGIEVVSIQIRGSDELRNALTMSVNNTTDALLVLRSGIIVDSYHQIAEFAMQHHIPAMSNDPLFVAEGGLFGYSPDYTAHVRRAAVYVDKILKGENPADLPVEQPNTFRLVANLTTARALGSEIPLSILVQVDEVIE
ncbi:ABC transporter substrate-binding protein [Microvirga massiliensis]|uniref:ABC transporter substrate-binding protein n=1 Tax=Microvirga massiliensis TaxID=1033741 RepID=UPI00062BDF32|nr:ABC transporter substrate-binding protein [Microvirga massiliensis]